MIDVDTRPNMPYVWQLVAAIKDENAKMDQYHYGDMSMVRQSYVDACILAKRTANKVAITSHHPAVKHYEALNNSLTDAEITLVDLAVPNTDWR